jgi:hypothetical protein
MKNKILLGKWRFMLPATETALHEHMGEDGDEQAESPALAFMTPDHHRVRNFVVSELPKAAAPLSPDLIAGRLDLPVEDVVALLDDLEKHLTFLFRNPQGAVEWAYPVTAARTPHKVTFSSGEKLYAAWAVDAIATPFVQGQLRQEKLSFLIETECAHCRKPIHIQIDCDLNYKVLEPDASPLVFVPNLDFATLKDPSIIDGFWRKSIFFWSEEHARAYRFQKGGGPGTYLNLSQCVYITPLTQGPLFGFKK